ncbi:MAG: 2-octaprenyl-6-methoxyphenyl hydroxylase [Pseudomonadales bacterium]|nr:2-octaprenyl-6-methoxyphenyl hydroxylase [Pseudomonadales bacterium]
MEITAAQPAYDIAIIGAGMVGASFALSLIRRQAQAQQTAGAHGQKKPLKILLIESRAIDSGSGETADFDARSTALAYGSKRVFADLGLWPALAGHAGRIERIHVSDRGHFGASRLAASDMGVEALGYVLENHKLGSVLNQAVLAEPGIDLLSSAQVQALQPLQQGMRMELVVAGQAQQPVSAALVVMADGGKSGLAASLGIQVSSKDYQQSALIANVALARPHQGVAYERFTDTGPLALLPLADYAEQPRVALVWTLQADAAAATAAMAEDEFLAQLQQRFGQRLGRFTQVGQRIAFPLKLQVTGEQVRPGLVLLGNSAHTLHPVAGQGLNLALRDAVVLADKILAARQEGVSPGAMSLLQDYQHARAQDQRNTILLSDQLIALFSNGSIGKSLLRKAGLLAIDLLPPLKAEFTRHAMGLAASGAKG